MIFQILLYLWFIKQSNSMKKDKLRQQAIKMNDKEIKALKIMAAKKGMSISAYGRSVLVKAIKSELIQLEK